ncbi:hypothetical protein G7055_01105 [Streptococcus pyogenes]|nr:hypothetical protein G7055_01105 [Streptococcus pyogenes]
MVENTLNYYVAGYLWLLALAILITVSIQRGCGYPLGVDHLKLEQVVFMSKDAILHNYNLDYSITSPILFVTKVGILVLLSSADGSEAFCSLEVAFHLTQVVFSWPSLQPLKTFTQGLKPNVSGSFKNL